MTCPNRGKLNRLAAPSGAIRPISLIFVECVGSAAIDVLFERHDLIIYDPPNAVIGVPHRAARLRHLVAVFFGNDPSSVV